MQETSSRLGFSNDPGKGTPLTIFVEPWAEDFTLLPGEELEIVARGRGTAPWFQVVVTEQAIQVYCEETSAFAVFQHGEPIGIGHRRDASLVF